MPLALKIYFTRLNRKDQKFEPGKYDTCLFVSDKVILLVYVDDCIWFAK